MPHKVSQAVTQSFEKTGDILKYFRQKQRPVSSLASVQPSHHSRQNNSVSRPKVKLVKVPPKRDYADLKIRATEKDRFLTSYAATYNTINKKQDQDQDQKSSTPKSRASTAVRKTSSRFEAQEVNRLLAPKTKDQEDSTVQQDARIKVAMDSLQSFYSRQQKISTQPLPQDESPDQPPLDQEQLVAHIFANKENLAEYLTQDIPEDEIALKEYIMKHEGYFRHVAGLCKCLQCSCRHCRCDYVRTALQPGSGVSSYQASFAPLSQPTSQHSLHRSLSTLNSMKPTQMIDHSDSHRVISHQSSHRAEFRPPGAQYPARAHGYQPIPKNSSLIKQSNYKKEHNTKPLVYGQNLKYDKVHTFAQIPFMGKSSYRGDFCRDNKPHSRLKITHPSLGMQALREQLIQSQHHKAEYGDKSKIAPGMNQEIQEPNGRNKNRVAYKDNLQVYPQKGGSWGSGQFQTTQQCFHPVLPNHGCQCSK